MIGDGGKPGAWGDRDRLLLLAYQLHEESLCGGCGQPKDQAYNPDALGHYEHRSVVCNACAAIASGQDPKVTQEPGTKRYAQWTGPAPETLRPWSLGPQRPHDHTGRDEDHPGEGE